MRGLYDGRKNRFESSKTNGRERRSLENTALASK
jgi:hypothetical protein